MSEPPEFNMDPLITPYLEFWSNCVGQANHATREMAQSANRAADPRDWQRRWLEAVSQSTDAYMRSPAFLSAMKRNMDAAIKSKLQVDHLQNEFASRANIPTAADVSGLFERLRGIEELILKRLNAIESRLNDMEHRRDGSDPAH